MAISKIEVLAMSKIAYLVGELVQMAVSHVGTMTISNEFRQLWQGVYRSHAQCIDRHGGNKLVSGDK